MFEKEDAMNISDRIKELRKSLGLSQEEFGQTLGVSRDVIGNIEYDRLKRPEQKEPIYKLICEKFNVNEAWLRTGEGNRFKNTPPENEIATAIYNVLEDVDCNNTIYTLAKEFLLKYEKLDIKSQKVIENYVDDVISSIAKKEEE